VTWKLRFNDSYLPNHHANSRQLQPDVALRVGFQLRRKGPKNKSLNDESRCQTEGPSDQKPTGALFHVAVGYRSEQHAYGSNEQNRSVVRWKTERHLASRTCPNGSRVVAVCEAELTHRACERPPYAHHLLSQVELPLSSQDSPRCSSKDNPLSPYLPVPVRVSVWGLFGALSRSRARLE
jgi:hypothetical protein